MKMPRKCHNYKAEPSGSLERRRRTMAIQVQHETTNAQRKKNGNKGTTLQPSVETLLGGLKTHFGLHNTLMTIRRLR